MIYILFNPLANNSRGEADAKSFATRFSENVNYVSVIDLNYKKFFDTKKASDEVILCGGDGTLNRFVNDLYGYKFKCKLSYAKCGSGNDFYRDVKEYEKDGRVELTQFIYKLPVIHVNGISKRFLNGIGYGIDGDTCKVGDDIRAKDPNAKINYSSIAIKLLLTKFKTKNATIEVDGKTISFKHVWLAATMYGKYYGGGMMSAPDQDRLKKKDSVDLIVYSSIGRIRTLLRFPKFSAGKHKGKKFLTHFTGKKVKVSFDKPCALQIDGDVVRDVTTYTVEF